MNSQNHQQLVFEDGGAELVWIGGAIATIAFGICMVLPIFRTTSFLIPIGFGIGVIFGLGMIFLYSNLTIIADRSTRTLRLEYRYLLGHKTRVFLFDEIENIYTEKTSATASSNTRAGYRIVATLTNGKTVYFRESSSSGNEKIKQAERLLTFIKHKSPAKENKDAIFKEITE